MLRGPPRGEEVPSESVGEYLEAIYRLEQKVSPVATSALAARLERSPASVSEMMRKLAQQELVLYEPYRGVSLTEDGKRTALRLIRRHRLWERFLTDLLGLSWDVVHEEACRLEHAASDLVTERLAEVLERSETCHHGHPIPTAQGEVAVEATKPLTELEPGEKGLVQYIVEERSDLLRYLKDLGLVPEATVHLEAKAPFEGPLTVGVEEEQHILGQRAASLVMVKPL